MRVALLFHLVQFSSPDFTEFCSNCKFSGELKNALKIIMVTDETFPRDKFPICVKSCPAFPNLCGKLRSALPGITISGITAGVISGATDLKA